MVRTVLITIFILILYNLNIFAQSNVSQNNPASENPVLVNRDVITSNHIDLYPNPAIDFLNVSIDNSTLQNVEFELYSIIGNKMDIKVEKVKANSYKISTKEFNPGYYLIVVKDPIKRFNKSFKFQKQ